jgi:hypothetical protein
MRRGRLRKLEAGKLLRKNDLTCFLVSSNVINEQRAFLALSTGFILTPIFQANGWSFGTTWACI